MGTGFSFFSLAVHARAEEQWSDPELLVLVSVLWLVIGLRIFWSIFPRHPKPSAAEHSGRTK